MLVIKAAVIAAPPAKPRRLSKTIPKPRNFFTIHSNPNSAFTLKLDENTRTSVVGFKDWDDAFFIGKMIETHVLRQKDWPDTREPGALSLPTAQPGDILNLVYIQKWDFEELKMTCTKNFLDLIGVEGIVKKKTGSYMFDGNVYKFQADWDFYRDRLTELHELTSPVDDF
jgi:hypothetical protein